MKNKLFVRKVGNELMDSLFDFFYEKISLSGEVEKKLTKNKKE